MKKSFFSTVIVLSFCVTFSSARAQSRDVHVTGPQQPSSTFDGGNAEQSAINTSAIDNGEGSGSSDSSTRMSKRISITSLPSDDSATSEPVVESAANLPAPATTIYRLGVGDVLDIQLLNSPIRESTLYSVLAGGLLEYPLAGDAIRVQGLTTDEISSILTSKIKIYEKPQLSISVREYASHNVIITGLVRDPGTKSLRREAVPLFVVLVEAQPRPEAARAIILRPGGPAQSIDISDTAATSVLIYPNDVIRLVAALPAKPLYFYIIGSVASPGQRNFSPAMTLTQSIFAAGGATQSAGKKVKIMRQGEDGLLITTEYNLKRIEEGKDPDPQIEAGDRIEVSRSGW